MFLFGPIITLALTNNPHLPERLTNAYKVAEEAEQAANNGKHEEAVQLYAEAIWMGRKPTLALQEEEEGVDGSTDALDWLIQSYCKSSTIKLQIDDLDGARGDAWAACVFSQNLHVPSLECMIAVCNKTDDLLGEVQAIKSILELEPYNDDKSGSVSQEEIAEQRKEMVLRLKELEHELDERFGKK